MKPIDSFYSCGKYWMKRRAKIGAAVVTTVMTTVVTTLVTTLVKGVKKLPCRARSLASILVAGSLVAVMSPSLISCFGRANNDIPICGNGKVEGSEECDDGNRYDGDGCSSMCLLESSYCGDGVCDPSTEDAASCSRDCFCGDGVVDSTEECEPGALQGMTCADFQACTGGTLSCDERFCLFDLSGCDCPGYCGDGIIDEGEECDDGNNQDGDGCDADCMWEYECGNGVVEQPEECDCGTDPENLPQGCEEVNGHPAGSCTVTCELKTPCSTSPFEVCVPSIDGDCCPDPYGKEYTCVSKDPTASICLSECSDTSDCYYNMYCEESLAGGSCYFANCGPQGDPEVGSEFNAPCTVPGGGEGYCRPQGIAQDWIGVCVENGEGAHGDGCDYVEGASIDITFQPREMAWDRCEKGFCAENSEAEGGGQCLQFCEWEVAYYDGASDCPSGFTCIDLSYIQLTDDEDDGLRRSEFGYCIEENSNPNVGVVTCDILNGEVIPGREDTCAQFNDAAGDNFICWPIHFGNGEMGWGTPVGWCMNVGEPASKQLGEECDIENDLCEEGSFCFPTLTTDWTSTGQCMAFCDMNNDDCATRGDLPSDSSCMSVSAWYRPGATQGSTTDGAPAHLGLCGCPEDGCGG